MKLADYFRIPSVRHYLIVRADRRLGYSSRARPAGFITTRIIRDGTIRLDPPGIELADIFEPPASGDMR